MRVLILTALFSLNVSTLAASPSLHLHSDIGYSCASDERRYHGGMFGAGGQLDLLESVRVGVRYQLSEHRGKGQAFTFHQPALGGVLILDVFHYVPWAAVYVGPAWSKKHPSLSSPDFGYSFDVGVDRLLDRDWSIGAFLQFHSLSSIERHPGLMHGGVRVSYTLQTEDPFDD